VPTRRRRRCDVHIGKDSDRSRKTRKLRCEHESGTTLELEVGQPGTTNLASIFTRRPRQGHDFALVSSRPAAGARIRFSGVRRDERPRALGPRATGEDAGLPDHPVHSGPFLLRFLRAAVLEVREHPVQSGAAVEDGVPFASMPRCPDCVVGMEPQPSSFPTSMNLPPPDPFLPSFCRKLDRPASSGPALPCAPGRSFFPLRDSLQCLGPICVSSVAVLGSPSWRAAPGLSGFTSEKRRRAGHARRRRAAGAASGGFGFLVSRGHGVAMSFTAQTRCTS